MAFLKKVSTNVARAKQMAMAKIGQAESTIDPEFNQLETSLREQHNKMKKLTKFVQSYQQAIADLGLAQQGMSQMISDQYEPQDRMHPIADQLANQITPQIEIYRDATEKYFNENFFQPLDRYLAQYKILEERIAERNTRLVDMDRYTAEVKALQTKSETAPTKLQLAKEKAEQKRVDYIKLNEELIKDIQSLLRDRARFFDALFANLMQGQREYLANTGGVLRSMEGQFDGINRTAVRTWPAVVTDPMTSAFQTPGGATLINNAAPNFNKLDDLSQTAAAKPSVLSQPTPDPYQSSANFNPIELNKQPIPAAAPIPDPYQSAYQLNNPFMQSSLPPHAAPQAPASSILSPIPSNPSPYGYEVPQGQPGLQVPVPSSTGENPFAMYDNPFQPAPSNSFAAQQPYSDPYSDPYGAPPPAFSSSVPLGSNPFVNMGATDTAPMMQPGVPQPAGAGARPIAVALYPFQGQDHTELSFQYNEQIVVTNQAGEWWEGEINGRRGLFPAAYVKLL